MNQRKKQLRQISIFESFSSSKKLKMSEATTSEKSELRDKMAAAADYRRQAENDKIDETSIECQYPIEGERISSRFSASLNSPEMFTREDFSKEQVILETPPFSEEIDECDSADLFSEMEEHDSDATCIVEYSSDEDEELLFLNRSPECSLPLPQLEPLENHSIMFSPHIIEGKAPRPFPSSYQDKWDENHVRMPCSPQNRYPVVDLNGEQEIQRRWGIISKSLSEEIESSYHLEAAIMRYNRQYIGRWNFQGLHSYINELLNEEEREYLFETLLPAMKKMALSLPAICTQPIPLLKKSKDHCLTLSQKQIGCLLANAFFCTFPRRNLPSKHQKQRRSHEYATYPDINFNRLFYGTKKGIPSIGAEKLKCLFNYFKRILSLEPSGTVSFHRQYLQEIPDWENSTRGIRSVVIRCSGFIEKEGQGMLQVDFANKYVGGGVIGGGCVQEEIRFIICPELIVSRLFVERLDPTEALIITGVEQYNKYSGYSESFKWEGDLKDPVPRDKWGRKCTQLVAMDAINFSRVDNQFQPSCIKRELNKAFSAFHEFAMPENLPAVATGNWGCGAFNGNPHLKFVIQLMAASQSGRSILYFTFGSKKLKKELKDIYEFLSAKNFNIGEIWRLLLMYSSEVTAVGKRINPTLYDFLHSIFSNEKKTQNTGEDDTLSDIPESDQDTSTKLDIRDDSSTDIATDVEPT